MKDEFLKELAAISNEKLTPIIEQILGDGYVPEGSIEASDIGLTSAGSGTIGIGRVTGTARSVEDTRQWGVVVKAVSDDAGEVSHNMSTTAQREVDFYVAGEFTEAQGGLRAAHCYKVEPIADGSTWLWIEDLSDAVQPPWTPEQFVTSARHLGAWNGYWSGDNLPDLPWMSKNALQLTYFSDMARSNIDLYFQYKDNPLSKLAIDPKLADRFTTLFDEAKFILELTSGTPYVLSHVNAMSKNLFPSSDSVGKDITVGIDWASVGPERAGADAVYSIASAAHWMELPIDDAKRLIEPVIDAYTEGLYSTGWTGDQDLVRVVAYAVMGAAEAIKVTGVVGRASHIESVREHFETSFETPLEEIFEHWNPVIRLSLDYADRAIDMAQSISRR